MDTIKFNLKGKKILVTEDDDQLRGTIRDILVRLEGDVRIAENGLVAKTILDLNENTFDLILSDIKMPEMDGIQLLTYCKEKKLSAKFLIFTGFSELLETRSAAQLGADGFLAKPFRLAELLKTIEEVLSPTPVATDTLVIPESQNFCCISVDEFLSSTQLCSDIYINTGESKFIKIAKEGMKIEIARLQHFKTHKIEFLYVRTEDFHKYTGLSLKLAGAISKSDSLSAEKKMRFFKHTGEMLLQQIFTSGVEKGTCDNAFSMMDNTLKSIAENDDIFELLRGLQTNGDKIYAHSLAVSIYACMIGSKLGWTSAKNQQKVALAALFHDIGFRELSPGLHDKPRFKMTPAEVKSYESHPVRGKEILASIKGYPSDLLEIVGQHHENCTGNGYPSGAISTKIHPIAKLLRFTDEFVEKMGALEKVDRQAVTVILTELSISRIDEFDKNVVKGAFELFSIPLPVALKGKEAA